MRRHWRFLLLCVLVGALINFAVALAGTFDRWSDFTGTTSSPGLVDRELWQQNRPTWFSQDLWNIDHRTRWGFEWRSLVGDLNGHITTYQTTGVIPFDVPWEVGTYTRSGWPMRAFCGEEWLQVGRSSPKRSERRWLISSGGPYQDIPFRPLFPGFVLNTLLYACIVGGCVVLTRAVRRALRSGTGCCVHCGYDLRASPNGACPECGAIRKADRMTA